MVFDSRNPLYKSPFGAVGAGEKVAFSLLLPLRACWEGAFPPAALPPTTSPPPEPPG